MVKFQLFELGNVISIDDSVKGYEHDCDVLKARLYESLRPYLAGKSEVSVETFVKNMREILPSSKAYPELEDKMRDEIFRRTGKRPSAPINKGITGALYSWTAFMDPTRLIGLYSKKEDGAYVPAQLPDAVYVIEGSHQLAQQIGLTEPEAVAVALDIALTFEKEYPGNGYRQAFDLWMYYSAASFLQRTVGINHFTKDTGGHPLLIGRRDDDGIFIIDFSLSGKIRDYTSKAYDAAKKNLQENARNPLGCDQ